MNERIKNLARLGVAAGLAVGGAVQTLEIVNQHQTIDGLRQQVTEQDLTIKDLKNDTCWDFDFIKALGMRLGVPSPGFEDCDTIAPKGHPDPVPGKGG